MGRMLVHVYEETGIVFMAVCAGASVSTSPSGVVPLPGVASVSPGASFTDTGSEGDYADGVICMK